ncbi:MlaD family protein [Phycisphaera mikurensis]|uniref:Mce/MlaD domain-containing protein n=1 Tax=Phycisphaera mikurensis (strain NBRC 102666 / KCTC 22515 / FYK2301M01) TaxID=1142394 RepID=I0IEZ8_PHYMF|nr:hypothetical protein [Phycisphaera mikurensis]MBB6441630.1 ABC-type transporter Mla subunit MlaD [Phycisphaera mikurensis]BAM03836.1 hypothetical protein PSMK_16770 [Phycisphaera mikurensis NBRC 102666]
MAASNERAAFKAGLFILAMAVLAVVMVFLVRGFRGSLGDTQRVTVVFGPGANAAALTAGSPVRIFGVGVGSVAEARVVPDEEQGALVEVVASLPSGFDVMSDAEVIASASLTGESWLDFVTLGSGEKMEPGGRIDGSSGGFQKALDVVNEALPAAVQAVEQVTRVTQRLDALVVKLESQVDPLVADVTALTEVAASAAGELDALLGDSGGDLRSTFKSLAGVTEAAEAKVPALLDRGETLLTDADATLAKADPLLDRVGPVIADTRAVVSDVRGLVRTNAGPITRTVESLERTALDARGAASELRAAPWRILYKPKEKDQRNLALYAAARDYAAGAQDLEAAAEALRVAVEAAPEDGTLSAEETERLAELRRRVVGSYDNYERVQAQLWQQFER